MDGQYVSKCWLFVCWEMWHQHHVKARSCKGIKAVCCAVHKAGAPSADPWALQECICLLPSVVGG